MLLVSVVVVVWWSVLPSEVTKIPAQIQPTIIVEVRQAQGQKDDGGRTFYTRTFDSHCYARRSPLINLKIRSGRLTMWDVLPSKVAILV
mmetsp:Transcript_29894/g.71065  ORF Transcript_29894/g.71065 Transcript_29894/m.71065 type:complete len:89 (+) Transcript_29894:78-344(+)